MRKAVQTNLEQAYATYEYTPNGKQKTVIDANGNRATMTWDGHDRQSRWTFPAQGLVSGYNPLTVASALATAGAANTSDFEEYTYDANGNRRSLRKRDGRLINYEYDALNRVTSKTYPSIDSRAKNVFYAYDLRGLQTAARFDSPSGADAVLSEWNGFGEQISSTTNMGGTSRTLAYRYDADGKRTRVTHLAHPGQPYLQYDRDGLGRIDTIALNGTTAAIRYQYTPQGEVGSIQRGVSGGLGIPTTYDYDGIGRLRTLAHDVTNAFDLTLGFSHNPAGQITSMTRNNDAYAFGGHMNVQRAYARNGLNQYTSAGPAVFTHDANGNLTSDGTTGFGYDIENRMVSTSTGWTLTYDPLGRLWQNANGANASQMQWDGDEMVAEYGLNGALFSTQVHGDTPDDPLLFYTGAGLAGPNYYLADHQGSIVAITNATGAVTAANKYDEYGIQNGNQGRFQYTGQIWLSLGMYYYKARMYSPTLGRFMQTDPIGYDDQVNLYAYVGNDPVNGKDPTGLSCTQNGEGTYSCQIDRVAYKDDNGKVQYRNATTDDHKAYAKVEGAMTNAANAASKAGASSFQVKVDGMEPFSVTGNEIASNLASAVATVDPNNVSLDSRTPNAIMTMSPGDLRVYSRALDSRPGLGTSDQLTVQFLHEGIHQTPAEVNARGGLPLDQGAHQNPYNGVALKIFGRR